MPAPDHADHAAFPAWHDIGASDDFLHEQPRAVAVGSTELAVVRVDDAVYAIDDACTHGAARLSDGFVADGCIECPLHQGMFDLRTGAPHCPPVEKAVRTYPVRLLEGRVLVQFDALGQTDPNQSASAQPHQENS